LIVNFKLAVRHKKPKAEVREKFMQYTNAYDEKAGDLTIRDKLEHRDLFNMYVSYMASSGERNIIY
jgi:hypothetical protein